MKPLGAQLIAEFVDCAKPLLNDKDGIEAALSQCIEEANLHLVSIHSHQFDPIGITSVAIIGESHVVVHTYPEAQHVSADIFTCSSGTKAPVEMMHLLKRRFKPKTLRFVEIQRGNPLETRLQDWITSSTTYGFEVRYHVKKRILSEKSEYQQIDIIDNDSFGKMLFLDNDLQISEFDAHIYNDCLVGPVVKNGAAPRRTAILGGGDGGVLRTLLRYEPEEVVLIDIDGDVIRHARRHLRKICGSSFSDPRVTVVNADANQYIKDAHGFDAVIYDLTMHPSSLTRMDRTRFLRQLFRRLYESLGPGGVVSLQCCSEFDPATRALIERLLGEHFTGLEFKRTFIPSFCESWIFASARKA